MEVQRSVRIRSWKYLRLSLYSDPPSPDLSLEMVLRAIHDRMLCLQSLDSSSNPTETVDKFLPSHGDRMAEDVFHRDQSSHFMLRAICSETDSLFQWFLSHELKLFHFKLRRESASSLLSFCARNTLKLQRVDGEELAEIGAQLIACQASGEDLEHHFKVPFTFVLNLVASRSVFLHLGYAFVPASALGSILKYRLEIITEGIPLAKVNFSKMLGDLISWSP